MDNGYSLSDIAAASGSMFGGSNEFIWIFALLILFGGNFGFNRQGDFSQYATAASQNEILSGQKFDALARQINQVGDGLCSSTYALNNAIVGEGRTLQSSCCELKYDMATQFANVNANTTAQTQKILDAIAQDKIASLQNQVNQLQLAQAMCGTPKINPYLYGVYPYSTSCGCTNV